MGDEDRHHDDYEVRRWEIDRLCDLGFKPQAALALAEAGVSWHDAEKLIRAGCHPRFARRILLPA